MPACPQAQFIEGMFFHALKSELVFNCIFPLADDKKCIISSAGGPLDLVSWTSYLTKMFAEVKKMDTEVTKRTFGLLTFQPDA
jgi:hypothetical protein